MAINFPNNPVNGDTHVVDNITYTYDSAKGKWDISDQSVVYGNLADIRQSIIPRLDGQYDLGSSGRRWKDLYLSGTSIDLGGLILTNNNGTLNVDGAAVGSGGGGISNVVEDTTPQLGGNLDTNGFDIAPADTTNNAQADNFIIHAKNSTSTFATDGGGNLILRGGSGYGGGDVTVIGGEATDISGLAGDVIISGGSRDTIPYTGDVKIQGLTYPSSDGTNGQVLTTDGSGTLSFQDAPYSPTTPTDWNGTPPTTISEALDRLAAVVKTLNGGTGA